MQSITGGGLKGLRKTIEKKRKTFIQNYLAVSDSSALSSVANANRLVSTSDFFNLPLLDHLGPYC